MPVVTDSFSEKRQRSASGGVKRGELGPIGRFVSSTHDMEKIRFKLARWEGAVINVSPEYEDCKRLALKRKIPLKKCSRKPEDWR